MSGRDRTARPAPARARRQSADPFGDVLPARSRDEDAAGWGDAEDDAEERLRREVPPHHG